MPSAAGPADHRRNGNIDGATQTKAAWEELETVMTTHNLEFRDIKQHVCAKLANNCRTG